MLDHSRPDYRISDPKENLSDNATGEKYSKESSVVTENIKKLGVELRETKMNLNGLLEKQKEFCEQFGKDMSAEKFARLSNAIGEIRENIECLRQMEEAIRIHMQIMLITDKLYKHKLENFEEKIEN